MLESDAPTNRRYAHTLISKLIKNRHQSFFKISRRLKRPVFHFLCALSIRPIGQNISQVSYQINMHTLQKLKLTSNRVYDTLNGRHGYWNVPYPLFKLL